MTFTIVFFGWIFSLCLHEFSHALVAYLADAAQIKSLNPYTYAWGNPVTSLGWPSHYVEDYTSQAQGFQSQVTSLITEGVFARLEGRGQVWMTATEAALFDGGRPVTAYIGDAAIGERPPGQRRSWSSHSSPLAHTQPCSPAEGKRTGK